MAYEKNRTVNVFHKAGSAGPIFLLTYIGAAIYFVQQSGGGFWEVIVALLQAVVWPAYVVYHVLSLLGA